MENPVEIFGEREKSAVAALVEEYKARLTQILALDMEVHRWSASYLVALVISIGWVLGSDKIGSLGGLFVEGRNPRYDNCYLILAVATINALYILWMSLKGFQTQQLYLYLYSVTGKQISELIGKRYNSYEVWRRSSVFCSEKRIGKLDWRRAFFFASFTLLPLSVSFSILWMYGQFVLFNDAVIITDPSVHRTQALVYFAIIAAHVVIVFVSVSTTKLNPIWVDSAKRELADKSEESISSYISQLLYKRRGAIESGDTRMTDAGLSPSEDKSGNEEATEAVSRDPNSTERKRRNPRKK